MGTVLRLILKGEKLDITTDTPFVLMVRDLLYEGDWESMENDLKGNDKVTKEIGTCKVIEDKITSLGEEVYEPVSYPEFREWMDEVGLNVGDFQHVSLNGLYDLALDYADKNLYDVAQSIINFMLELDPNYAPGYELLGSLYIEQGRIEEGLRYLDKAVEIDPWLVEAYSSLGEAYYNMGDYRKAVHYWEKEIERAPENKLTYFMIADAYDKMEEYEKAVGVLSKLLERDPGSILARYEMAQFYRKMGEEERAESIEDEIASMEPKYSSDVEVWAKVLLKRGEYRKVLEVLERFAENLKLNTHVKMLLVIPYVKLGMTEKAKEIVENLKDNNMWYYYGKKELYSEFLTQEEMELCGIS